MSEELAYSIHLGSDKNKTTKARQTAKNNPSGKTSFANNGIQNATQLSKVNKHNLRDYDNNKDNIYILYGTDNLYQDVQDLYFLVGDYYIPNIVAPKQEKITLNKYGRMRLKYLKEYKKADYTIMLMDGTLNTHLKELQETADNRMQQIISELKVKSNLNENMKNTDMLYWVGTMNSIKAQAEEMVFNELIYR